MAEIKMMKLSIDEIDDEDLYLQLQRYLILNPRFQQSFHSVTSYPSAPVLLPNKILLHCCKEILL